MLFTKRLFFLLMFASFFLPVRSMGQTEKFTPVKFAGMINKSFSSSNDPADMIVTFAIVDGRRTFEAGLLFTEDEKFAGGEFTHKIFLNKSKSHYGYSVHHFNFRPFIKYHFQYHYTNSKQQVIEGRILKSGNQATLEELEEVEKVATMNHYLGLGLEQDLFNGLFASGSVGVGLYLGKNNNENVIDPLIEQHQENGLSFNVHFGIGYRF